MMIMKILLSSIKIFSLICLLFFVGCSSVKTYQVQQVSYTSPASSTVTYYQPGYYSWGYYQPAVVYPQPYSGRVTTWRYTSWRY